MQDDRFYFSLFIDKMSRISFYNLYYLLCCCYHKCNSNIIQAEVEKKQTYLHDAVDTLSQEGTKSQTLQIDTPTQTVTTKKKP